MNPSSIGGSKLTVAAECIATSMPAGISGWPRPKSASITSTRSSSIAFRPSSPTRSRRVSNAGLRNRYSTRSRLDAPVWLRTSSTTRVSGKSASSRSNTTCARKPVTPVSSIVVPERASTIEDDARAPRLSHAAEYAFSTGR